MMLSCSGRKAGFVEERGCMMVYAYDWLEEQAAYSHLLVCCVPRQPWLPFLISGIGPSTGFSGGASLGSDYANSKFDDCYSCRLVRILYRVTGSKKNNILPRR